MNNEPPQPAARYYWTGGTMPPLNRSYIERRADQDLYEALKAGDFCYILTSRQMGKSSLISRAASRLRSEGFRFGFVDLSGLGKNLTAVQWFDGMLERIGDDFGIEDEIDDFRANNANLGPQQMWLEVIRRVVLTRVEGRVVIVIDEIDYVRSIDAFSTDELFTGIRELFNRRSRDESLDRLSFCLLGVASPADLIENKEITPFNIGHRIELRDFTLAEVQALAKGMPRFAPEKARELVSRVFHWTGGQPYLTQKICAMVAADESVQKPADVDRLVTDNFLSQRARETDDNLTAIRDRIDKERILNPEFTTKLLGIYRRVLNGGRVEDSEVLPEVAALKLTGLVRGESGKLVVKSPIYRKNFDSRWIADRIPKNWARAAAFWSRAAVIVVLLVGPAVALWALIQKNEIQRDLAASMKEKKEADDLIDKARAKTIEATKKAESAELARRDADIKVKNSNEAAEKAIALEAKANEALGKLYKAQTESHWKDGNRIVEGAFFRRAMESSSIIRPEIVSKVTDNAGTLLGVEKTGENRNSVATTPVTYFIDRENRSFLKPAGGFRMAGESPVTGIIPWSAQPGFIVMQEDKNHGNLTRLFTWDLARPNRPKPSLMFPLTRNDLPDPLDPGVSKLVRSLDVSPDEKRLMLVDVNGKLILWELQPSISQLPFVIKHPVEAAAFLPGGKNIVAALTGGPVVSIDLDTGTESDPILKAGGKWTALGVTSDGSRMLVGQADGTVVIADPQKSSVPLFSWRMPGGISAVAFFPDGKRFAVAATQIEDGKGEKSIVEIREIGDGKAPVASFNLPTGIESIGVAPDGSRVAVGTKAGTALLLDGNNLRKVAGIEPWKVESLSGPNYESRINTAFSIDGKTLFASNCMGEIGAWRAIDGAAVIPVEDHSLAKVLVVPLADGKILHGGIVNHRDDLAGDVAILEPSFEEGLFKQLSKDPELDSDKTESNLPELTTSGLSAVAFCPPEGMIALAIVQSNAYEVGNYLQHVSVGKAGSFDALASLVKSASDGEIAPRANELRLGPNDFKDPKTLATNKAAASSVSRRRSGPVRDSESTDALEAPCALAISNDGSLLAAGFTDGYVSLIRLPGQSGQDAEQPAKPICRWRSKLNKKGTEVKTLTFVSDGTILLVGDDKQYTAYRSRNGEFESEDGFCGPVAVAPNDLDHFAGRDNGGSGIHLGMAYDVYASTTARSFVPSPASFAFSPDGAWQAAGLKSGAIRLNWKGNLVETVSGFSQKRDPDGGDEVSNLASSQTRAVAFSPDGGHLAAGDERGWLHIWKLCQQPEPVIREGETLEEAQTRWSLDVSDSMDVIGVPNHDDAWRTVTADPVMSQGLVNSWKLVRQMGCWYHRPSPSVPTGEVALRLSAARTHRSDLVAVGLDCSHLDQLADLERMLEPKPPDRSNESDLIDRIESLPAPQRWLLLSSRLKEWKLSKTQAHKLWLEFAGLQEDRLGGLVHMPEEKLSKEWRAVFNEGVAAVKQAAMTGGREESDFRRASGLYASKGLADLRKKMDRIEEHSRKLDNLRQEIGADTEKGMQYLKAYDLAVDSGYVPSLYQANTASIQARTLSNYQRAAGYLKAVEDLPDDVGSQSFYELAWSYLEEEAGTKAKALDHARAASRFPIREEEAWKQRCELEGAIALETGDQAGLVTCLRELEKTAGDKRLEEPWTKILLKQAEYFNQIGETAKIRAYTNEVFKKYPESIPLYRAFWEGGSFPDEEHRKWSLGLLNQGVEVARKNVTDNSEKTLKDDLFYLISRRAAHHRGYFDLRLSAAGFIDADAHKVDDGDKGWLLTELGDTLRDLGLYAEAEKCFEAGLPLDTSTWAKDVHADLLEEMGRGSEAVQIDKELFESTEFDSESISGLAHADDYANSLRRAGRGDEALQVLQRAIEANSGILPTDKLDCLYSLALSLRKASELKDTPPEQAAGMKEQLQEVVIQMEKLLGSLPADSRPDETVIWTGWLKGDLPGALRLASEIDTRKPASLAHKSMRNAALAAWMENREGALAWLADAVSRQYYDGFVPEISDEYDALAAFPETVELIKLLPIKSFAELPVREERLADWMDSLNITDPAPKKIVSDAAARCRTRAVEDRAKPLGIPEGLLTPPDE